MSLCWSKMQAVDMLVGYSGVTWPESTFTDVKEVR